MTDEFLDRLTAVERAVTDGETDLAAVADAATVDARLDEVDARLDEVEDRLAALDATTQAMRGYLSGVDGVTDDVERQAALALAKAEAIEAHVFDADDGLAVERLQQPGGSTGTEETHDATADGRARRTERTLSRQASPDPSSSSRLDDCRVPDSDESTSSLVTRLRDAL